MSPEPTPSFLPKGVSLSYVELTIESQTEVLTMLESLSLSEASIEVRSLTFLTYSMNQEWYTEVMSVSRSAVQFRTWFTGVIEVMVYVVSRSQVMVSRYLSMPADDESTSAMDSGLLIGVVSGSGAVLAILAGLVLFLIRFRGGGSDGFDAIERAAPLHCTLEPDVVAEYREVVPEPDARTLSDVDDLEDAEATNELYI
jgi:hypothetical protein